MKVAITGGNGFLARYCVEVMEQNDITPVLLTRLPGAYKSYQYTVTDYSKEDLIRIFREREVDAIAHIAGPRKNHPLITQYNDYFDATTAVYDAASELGIKNIVFASSISVYAGNSLPYREEQIPIPGNNYGISKIVGEQIGNLYSRIHGLCIKNLRFAHLYGANENNKYMINQFFRQAFAHEQLCVYGKGVAKREMMYAKDAAEAVLCALQKSSIAGTYNTGSGDSLTNEEIAKAICRCMSPENSVVVGDAVENMNSSFMNNDKIYEELGFSAKYTLDSALPEIYNDMLDAVSRQ